jgi:hypothetical protein
VSAPATPQDVAALVEQVNSLRDALRKVLDTRDKEARAHFAYQTASENYTGGAARESRQHLAAMTAASKAEREARVLLLTLRPFARTPDPSPTKD